MRFLYSNLFPRYTRYLFLSLRLPPIRIVVDKQMQESKAIIADDGYSKPNDILINIEIWFASQFERTISFCLS